MKFLLDACASSRSLMAMLRGEGHDVKTLSDRKAEDTQILDLALQERRVLITLDKDYGELVYVYRQRHGCIVRLVEMSVAEQIEGVRQLIEDHSDQLLESSLFVVTRSRVRYRPGGAG